MATTVKSKLIRGSAYVIDKSGGHKSEVYLVTGMDPADGDVHVQAAAATGVPRYFDAHATIGGIVATTIKVEPFKDSKTKAYVYVDFNTPEWSGAGGADSLLVRVDSSTQQVMTQFDKDGVLMAVEYTNPDGDAQTVEYAQFPTLENGTVLEFQKDLSLAEFQTWGTFRRRLNSDTWQGGAKRTWACKGVTGTSINSSFKMRASIRFEWKEHGWDDVAFWKDQVTDTQPDDIAPDYAANKDTADSGNGWTRGLILVEKDFEDLGFPEILTAP